MPGFLGNQYAPPGVYTRTVSETVAQAALDGLRLPVFIGPGSETLTQSNIGIIRGSSPQSAPRIPQEDETGRAVLSISGTGAVTLGAFNGTTRKIQVRNYPITTPTGTVPASITEAQITVTINRAPVVVLAADYTRGILDLSTPPALGDEVRVTYYFGRTDTLTTDDVSDQITASAAQLIGAIGQSYTIVQNTNDTLALTIDDATTLTAVIPAGTWTASEIAVFLNTSFAGTTFVASTAVNNFGATVVVLTAARNLSVGAGSANSTLGFSNGQATLRNATFYVFNGPIVTGNNGGVTTTDPANVVARVNGTQVTVTAVDGANRAVTLAFAPQVGATVTIQYFFNTWQDTFDYLPNTGVINISLCGLAPGRSDYIEGTDFVLQDDKILWGTAVSVNVGEHTANTTEFGPSQVSATLIDDRSYLTACSAVINSAVSPPVESRTQFTLPLQPTTGNGRDTPLGTTLYNTVANGRLDLPTNRPDLVWAYWGYSAQDALERGRVTVLQVNDTTITLADPVPVGASVYATFWYNRIQDAEYAVQTVVPGASGVGTFKILDDGVELVTPKYGTKSAGLAGITVQFPSGSERQPDVRYEVPFVTTDFSGPVEETVTVEFANTDGTLALYTVPNPGPYEIVLNQSDRARFTIDGADLASGAAGIDLGSPNGVANLGFTASMVGAEIAYDSASGFTTYEIDSTNNSINLTVDGVLVSATAASGATQTLAAYVTALNTASAATPSEYVAPGPFTSTVVVTANEYDQIRFHYTGDVAGASGNLLATVTPGTYTSATSLAAAVEAAMAAQIAGLGIGFAGLSVDVTADGNSRLVFALTKATGDAAGFLEFITNATAARDFATLAGIDTAIATGGSQTKLLQGPIARRYSVAGDNTSALDHDRLILRSRLVPGFGTVLPFFTLSYAGITVQGSTGADLAGLTVTDTVSAAWRATVIPASLSGNVGFANGQVPAATYGDARDGQPVVTFHAAGGSEPQNNVFTFSIDNIPVSVEFTDAAGAAIASGASADVPLGPATVANTVLAQIRAAMTAAGVSTPASRALQEGAGIRLFSATDTANSNITIGTGNANTVLGFVDADSVGRTLPAVSDVVSGLNAFSASSIADVYLDWTSSASGYMTWDALALVSTDDVGATYLSIQSLPASPAGLGPSSSVAVATPSSASILRPGVGTGMVAGQGSTGEDGVSGFFVTSTDTTNGSGTANNSSLNNGVGQDGLVGQTYRDDVTGLTFTILPRSGGSNYPSGETFTFVCRKIVTADANTILNTLPGVWLTVSNTLGVGVGDTALVFTFARSGAEPDVGDLYYVSYVYVKQDFEVGLFTKLSAIEQAYGPLNTDHPVTLAAYLAVLNGAALVGVKQVQRDTDTNSDGVNDDVSLQAYVNAVLDLQGPLPSGILPDILVPLKGDSLDLFQFMTQQADIQSSPRYRAERTILAGVSAGTQPSTVSAYAQAVNNARFRVVYPDSVILSVPQPIGPNQEVLADGTYLAAMMAGSVVSPNTDVATPWTGRRLAGGVRLGRTLTAPQQNAVAQTGVTILEDASTAIKVRHGLTSKYSDIYFRNPEITQISDEVQQQTRATLEPFVGTKFLPQVFSQIEGRLSMTMKDLVSSQIITGYKDIEAIRDPVDPTTCNVQAAYSPVFPLLYILATFSLTGS